MPSFLSTLSLFATAIVAVTNGQDACEFCPSDGIEFPDKVVNVDAGTTCADLPSMNNDTNLCALFEQSYGPMCCPSIKNSGCVMCPDGEYEDPGKVPNVGANTANCSDIVFSAAIQAAGDSCDTFVDLYDSECCSGGSDGGGGSGGGGDSASSATSSMIAFVATAGIGYVIAYF